MFILKHTPHTTPAGKCVCTSRTLCVLWHSRSVEEPHSYSHKHSEHKTHTHNNNNNNNTQQQRKTNRGPNNHPCTTSRTSVYCGMAVWKPEGMWVNMSFRMDSVRLQTDTCALKGRQFGGCLEVDIDMDVGYGVRRSGGSKEGLQQRSEECGGACSDLCTTHTNGAQKCRMTEWSQCPQILQTHNKQPTCACRLPVRPTAPPPYSR